MQSSSNYPLSTVPSCVRRILRIRSNPCAHNTARGHHILKGSSTATLRPCRPKEMNSWEPYPPSGHSASATPKNEGIKPAERTSVSALLNTSRAAKLKGQLEAGTGMASWRM